MAIQVDDQRPAGGRVSARRVAGGRHDDLAQIIRAYNQVTERLQHSHEALQVQVVRLQEELASTNAKLQRSRRLAALGEMAAGIAHEIRNPLAAIQLYAEMLVDDLSSSRAGALVNGSSAQTAGKIASAVRGLDEIVNDVLSFARELSPQVVPVPVARLFDRAIEACRPMITASGVSVARGDREAGIAGAACACVDPSLMHQALVNLIRNAVEAMSGGGQGDEGHRAAGVLTLGVRREGRRVILIVRDTGRGIAGVDVDRIFNPFFTTRDTGTGLGLAIIHRIIDAHGGTIGVHNDGGAVFELSLPVGSGSATEGSEAGGAGDPAGVGAVGLGGHGSVGVV